MSLILQRLFRTELIFEGLMSKCLFRPDTLILSKNTVLWEKMVSNNFALILYSKTHT